MPGQGQVLPSTSGALLRFLWLDLPPLGQIYCGHALFVMGGSVVSMQAVVGGMRLEASGTSVVGMRRPGMLATTACRMCVASLPCGQWLC